MVSKGEDGMEGEGIDEANGDRKWTWEGHSSKRDERSRPVMTLT